MANPQWLRDNAEKLNIANASQFKEFADDYEQLQAENKKLKEFALKLIDEEEELEYLDYWAEEYLHAYNQLSEINKIVAENKKKDKLIFAYESVRAPINPLLAANKELKERIEFAVEYLPESPDKALRFLEPALKGK